MPTNCSTLIQRKQNILHKILRSSSDDKIQNAVAETTSELRVAGTQKFAGHSGSANHINSTSPAAAAAAPSTARRTTLFTTNRVQPTNDQYYETHLPSIRDASGPVDRTQPSSDDVHSRSRPKTPLTTTAAAVSPKSTTRPPSASISSLFNTLAKRSTDNFHSSNGEIDEIRTTPQSRQSRRASNESSKYATNNTPTKHIYSTHKYSGDSGVESRHSSSPLDANQQYRMAAYSSRIRSDNSPGQETAKDKTISGQLYQRRTNNNTKAPTKQKIDKFRRRSEEVTQATTAHTNGLLTAAHTGLSATTPALTTTSSARIKPPSTPKPVRRVTSDAEIQARLEVLRLSMESNAVQTEQANVRQRAKSPYLYSTHQQLAPPTTPQTSSALRRSQPISTTTHNSNRQTPGVIYRRQQQQQQQQQQQTQQSSNKQSSNKQSQNSNQGNLYLAFIASRHLSTLEDTLFDCDIDHPKLLRIFTWLKNVEEHRHEQADHDQLIRQQNQLMLDREDNLSLYSEIQYAVDDLPPNTTGKPCEKIPTMQFED